MIITDLWKYYGDELIFKEVTATIGGNDRIGLVGANGLGKTTLLRVMAGRESFEKGSIDVPRKYVVGHLYQEVKPSSQNLRSYLEEPFADLLDLKAALKQAEQQLSLPAIYENAELLAKVMEEYAQLQHWWEEQGGYDYGVQIKSAALGLGFSEEEFGKRLDQMSGGERMRAQLARLLLSCPDLLVLDEPTNHLDVQAIEWLENFLASYERAVVVVSHDRFFLDKVATRIWEIQDQRIYQYKGNYSAYIPQRQSRMEQLQETKAKQQEEIKRIEVFVQKFRAGTRSKQAKSLEKRLGKMDLVQLNSADPTMRFSFRPKKQTGQRIVTLDGITKKFDDNPVLRGVSAEIRRGDRIALMGPNGCGKTTLLKCMTGDLSFSGTMRWGTGIELGYFSQDIRFEGSGTVLDELYNHHRLELGDLRSILARFLFKGEDVFKSVSVLSGGERNRLAMAKLLVDAPNFLVMDEPTNHLDIYARDALEKALLEFGGTLIFVSHDRYFVDRLATKVWVMDNGQVQEFEGNFSDYRLFLQGRLQGEKQKQKVEAREERRPKSADRQKELGKVLAKTEQDIETLEARKKDLEKEMSAENFFQDSSRSIVALTEYREIEDQLAILYNKWDELVLVEGEC